MGACAVGALAVTTGAELPATLAAVAVAATLGLARWRVTLALGLRARRARRAGRAAGARGRRASSPPLQIREPEAEPAGEFSPIVLAAILAYAATALTLLVVGQFVSLPPVAATLATVTVLTGMARAGLTVVERLRESRARRRHRRPDRPRQPPPPARPAGRRRLADKDGDVALLLIDLDGFKELNDTLGHSRRRRGPAPDRPAPAGGAAARATRSRGSAATSSRSSWTPATRRAPARRPAPARRARALVRRRRHPRPHRRQHRHRALPRARAPTRSGCCSAPTSRCTRPSARAPATRSTCPRATTTAAAGWRCSASCATALDERRARPALPAQGGARDRRGARRRGARALGAPAARPADAGATSSRSPSTAASAAR